MMNVACSCRFLRGPIAVLVGSIALLIPLAPSVLGEAPPTVVSAELCLEVDEDEWPYACTTPALDVIDASKQDMWVVFRVQVGEQRIYDAHVVEIRLVNPAGDEHPLDPAYIPHPSTEGYEWWNPGWVFTWPVEFYYTPETVERERGVWTFEVYVDGALQAVRHFTVLWPELPEESAPPEVSDALIQSIRNCLSMADRPVGNGPFMMVPEWNIQVGPEAAGFQYEILYDTETSGGTFAGLEIGLGPNARSLKMGGELDEAGTASVSAEWPIEAATIFFQVLIAITETELTAGSFWTSDVMRVDRSHEVGGSQSRTDQVPDTGESTSGSTELPCCACPWPYNADDSHEMHASPFGVAVSEDSPLSVAYTSDGFVDVSSSEVGQFEFFLPIPVEMPADSLPYIESVVVSFGVSDVSRIESVELICTHDDGTSYSLGLLSGGDLESISEAMLRGRIEVDRQLNPGPLLVIVKAYFGRVGAVGTIRVGPVRIYLRKPLPASSLAATPVCLGVSATTHLGPPTYSSTDRVEITITNRCEEAIRIQRIEVLHEDGDTRGIIVGGACLNPATLDPGETRTWTMYPRQIRGTGCGALLTKEGQHTVVVLTSQGLATCSFWYDP